MKTYKKYLSGLRTCKFITKTIVIAFIYTLGSAFAADTSSVDDEHRNFDARIQYNQKISQSLTTPQKNILQKC